MKPCISQATTMPSTFADDVANYADAGCMALEVWLTKLEQHLEHETAGDTKQMLAQRGMTLAAAAYQGGLLLAQGDARQAHYDHYRKRLELCEYFGIRTLLVVADFVEPLDQAALGRAVVSLQQAARWAAGFDVTLALEFRGKNTFCSSLDTAIALVEQCGEANVGINLDVYHYYTGPSKFEDFAHLTLERLAHVQVADLAGVPRELANDGDRVLPGDGDFQLDSVMAVLRTLGYEGWVSLELMNPTLWRANPKQVAEIAFTSLRRLLGLAAPADAAPPAAR
jgi:4-hydroxyphenylpyruvate dioxygenase